MEKWFDAQDDEGRWRVGFLIKEQNTNQKLIGLDGYHPNYNAYYCSHSDKISQVRTHTSGLTVPENGLTLRSPFQLQELQSMQGRINLYLLKNMIDLQPQAIKTYLRTDFLIQVDKIFTTPFQIIRDIKMADLHINKLFILFLTFYLKVVESSKKFMGLVDSNVTAFELYCSLYELTIILSMILGLNSRSKNFYLHNANLTIRSQGFRDYFIKSQGVLPFKLLLKNMGQIKNPTIKNLTISRQIINMILQLCEKEKNELIEGKLQQEMYLVVEEIVSHLKDLADKSEQIKDILSEDVGLISRIESIYSKLKPNKHCNLRKILQKIKEEPIVYSGDNQKITMLEERMHKLQVLLASKEKQKEKPQFQYSNLSKIKPNLPTQNLGEEMFLGSLEWALSNNDTQTARKLVKWRRTLLQVGRITGWEVALNIGYRTFKKAQIGHEDIIEANYQYLMKHSGMF